MKKIIILLISFYLYAASEAMDNNATLVVDMNKTIVLYRNENQNIDNQINKMDYFIKYEQYQKLEKTYKKK